MRLLVFALLFLLVAAPSHARPQRIVSLNLCTDQFLMALADKSQIAALSYLSRDPQLSASAATARTLPFTRGTAEDVLLLQPDLLLALPGYQPPQADIPLLALPPAESWPQIREQILIIANAIGHPARGRQLVARIEAQLTSIPPLGRDRTIASYQRRGFLSGQGTLSDDLIRRAGLVNMAANINRSPLAPMPLELLVANKPDLLLLDKGALSSADQASEMLRHPALADIPLISLPDSLTICGGPSYPQAARLIARQLQALDRRD